VSTVHLEADWLTLDNAAKIYPTASSKLFPTVFRLSAMLRAPVRLSALQQASNALLRRCPYFQVYLRRGLFWYYLQRHRDTPRVQLLDRSSLESLPAGGKTEHLLRIRARGRTIAVDFSHILTDGAGGLRFFRSLLAEYLKLCGVEIDEGLERCPLCLAPLGGEAEQGEEAPPSPGHLVSPVEVSKPFTLFRLWEIASLLAGTSAVVVFVADFAYGMTVTWARYPLVAIIFLWAASSLLLLLHRHRLLLLVAETVLAAIFLQTLDMLLPHKPWFLTLALPLTVLTGTFIGGVSALARALRPRVFTILAVVLVCAGLFLLGLETVISLHFSGAFRLSWSLVVFGCVAPLVGLLLYIQYRLKITSDDLGKIFHL